MRLLTIIATLTGLFFAFAPEDRILLVKTAYKRIVRDPGQLCFDYNAIALKDPKTAEILEVSKTSNLLSVTYRAKNGLGAFGTSVFRCQLTDGEFTEFDKLYESINTRLSAGVAVDRVEFDMLKKDLSRRTSSVLTRIQYLESKYYYMIRDSTN
jgi:hypothetical protein